MFINYENFIYMSKIFNNENLKFNICKEEDIEEIKHVIDYANGLVIKDYDAALEKETLYSNKQATMYITSFFDYGNTMTEFEKQIIINSYKESNPYYIKLYEEYGIPYLEARMASDYTILKATKNSLIPDDQVLFEQCYQHALNYFIKVLKTNAFKSEPLNKCYFREIIVFFAVQKYITRKMEKYFDPNRYTEYECKNHFISYGIDYFDSLPLEYKRKLIKNLNDIIKYKGTDKCLNLILETFGLGNIEIFKYVVSKDYKNNELITFQVPLTQEVNTEIDTVINLNDITKKDALWQCSESEILEHDFNVINTKYVSVNIAVDLLKSTYNMAYAVSILDYLDNNYITYSNKLDFCLYNKTISNDAIYIYDLLIAIIVMTYKKNNMSTKINFTFSENSVNGFNLEPMDEECRQLIRKIQLELIKNKKNMSNNDYIELYDFFVGFNLENFQSKNFYSEADLRRDYANNKDTLFHQIYSIAKKHNFQNILEKLTNKKIDYLLLDILEFYYTCCKDGFLDILEIKTNYLDVFNLLCKYNIFCYRNNEPLLERLTECLINDDNARHELEELIYRQNNIELLERYNSNDLDAVISMLKVIIEQKRDELFKEYTLEQTVEILNQDPTDIIYYKRLNAYFECYTKFYLTKSVSYNLNDLGRIFKYNEGLRDKLEEYISECNNLKLHELYLSLWDKVFVVKKNNAWMEKYDSWDNLLKDRNIDLFNFITQPTGLSTISKIKQWQNETLFELCETADTFFNAQKNIFSESTFIGASTFINRYIKIMILVFKAYTVDLTDGLENFSYNSKKDSFIKLIDDAMIDIKDVFIDRINIEDFLYICIRDVFKENLDIKEEVRINTKDTIYYGIKRYDSNKNLIDIVPSKSLNSEYSVTNRFEIEKYSSYKLSDFKLFDVYSKYRDDYDIFYQAIIYYDANMNIKNIINPDESDEDISIFIDGINPNNSLIRLETYPNRAYNESIETVDKFIIRYNEYHDKKITKSDFKELKLGDTINQG